MFRIRPRRRAFFGSVALATMALACSGLLGLTDPTLDPNVGANSAEGNDDGDGAALPDAADATSFDARLPDGGICSPSLATDSKNCGACGHDCLGGGCKAGWCQPVLVAKDFDEPNGIAAAIATDSDYVYVSTQSGLERFAKTDGTRKRLLEASSTYGQPAPLLVIGTSLYYRDSGGTIVSCVLPTCSNPIRVSSNVGTVRSLVKASGWGGSSAIAWFDTSNEHVAVPLADRRAKVVGTAAADRAGMVSQVIEGNKVALYWSENVSGCISRTYQGSELKVTFDTKPESPREFVVYGTDVVFTTSKNLLRGTLTAKSVINVKPLPGGSGLNFPSLIPDGDQFYLFESNRILRCDPNAGCPSGDPQVSVGQGLYLSAMTVEDRFFYFTQSEAVDTSGGPPLFRGSLWRVAK